VLIDKLAHACLIDGVRLSGAKLLRFNHNDTRHLEKLLQQNRDKYDNCLIITDTIFSMDGDAAPLVKISELKRKYNSWFMSDDAHGFMIAGKNANKNINIDIQMGTLSKYIGSYGGYVCGSKILIEYIKNTARSLIFSTALPPATLAAASAAIDVIIANPDLIYQPIKKAQLFCNEIGLPKAVSPIVPILCGSEKNALQASDWLKSKGFLVVAIRPPTVPKNTSRLRFSFSVRHSDADIIALANLVKSQNWHKRHLDFVT
jgi:8-amino-7-oxononanoate synthase